MAEIKKDCDNTVNINGIKYFKLVSTYPNDITKNCGLVGTEIDSNFYFLRGNDIDKVEVDGYDLVITRVNGEEIRTQLIVDESKDRPEISFNKRTGELTFVYPDETEVVVDGFALETLSEINVGSTLDGDGTLSDPLNINPVEITGYYSPVNEFVDLSNGETLPIKPKGYRVLTKEYSTDFGVLYSYKGLEKINNYFNSIDSAWRVPSNEEWTEMLNAIEICGDTNHDRLNNLNGLMASPELKSVDFWEFAETEEGDGTEGSDTYGFRLLPAGNDNDDATAEEFGRTSSLWSSDGYLRIFRYNDNRVENCQHRIKDFASIRLIKDSYYKSFEENEEILGNTYKTIKLAEESSDYERIWTNNNLMATEIDGEELIEGVDYIYPAIPDGLDVISTCFYVNYYTGDVDNFGNPIVKKKKLNEGDCVTILNYGEASYRKIQIKNNELFDEYEELKAKIEEIEAQIQGDIERVVLDVISQCMSGTSNEIKVTKTDDGKIVIGFSDDAIFG